MHAATGVGPPPVEPAYEPICAASLKLAHACTGAQLELEQCSVFTASAVTSEVTNNTSIDLAFVTGMMIHDGRGKQLLPTVLGPELTVPARSASRPWQIAMPRLPDGYILVRVMVLGTSPDGPDQSTYSEGQLRVRGGQVEVLDYHAWHAATDPGGVAVQPGQPEPAPAGPTPMERLYEELRAVARRPAAP